MVEAVGEESTPRPATLYLDGNLLDFLEEARIAGLVSRPKLDISKSAVVRLALRRLQQDMTIEEIRELLRSQPTDPTKMGRKRR
jgi:Arc/MetJ-type ribon-helix-helix transcriptional regulator